MKRNIVLLPLPRMTRDEFLEFHYTYLINYNIYYNTFYSGNHNKVLVFAIIIMEEGQDEESITYLKLMIKDAVHPPDDVIDYEITKITLGFEAATIDHIMAYLPIR